jgi:hypothetical protein
MKKLLLSTALAGVVLSTSAIAQTTVGGNMTVGFKATEEKGISGAATPASKRGMLIETQLNVASKGALNNGMNYAAGFSLEFDASDVASTAATKSIANENVYIDLISGNTTLSAGIDHMNDFDRSMIPVVGEYGKGTGSQGGTTAGVTNMLSDPVNTSQGAGVAVRQAFPGVGQITLAYTPTMTCNATDPQGCGGSDTNVLEGNEGSAYSALLEISNVGIKGLALEAGYAEQQKKVASTSSPTKDATFVTAGLRYTNGPITAGYNRKEFAFGGTTSTNASLSAGGYSANEERTQNDFGIAYTVGNISYGAVYQVTSSNISTELDEKYKAIGIGYNLGPVAAKANFAKHTNLGGLSGTDADIVTLKLSTNF